MTVKWYVSKLLMLVIQSNIWNDFTLCWCTRGVMVKALDCGIVVSTSEQHSHYNVYFQTYTFGKDMNPLILQAVWKIQGGTINLSPKKRRHDPFPFNENRFSFFVAYHLLVGQLCTNPKSDRSLLSCLKVTQCSTSEIRDAPLYNSCSLLIQVMKTGPLAAPSKCKSGLPRITGNKSFWLRLWSLVWFQVRATSCHLISSKSAWKSTPKCTWMCWRVWWSPGAIRWPVTEPGCGSRIRRRPTSPKRPRLGFRRSATTLYSSLTGPLLPSHEPAGRLRFGHTPGTSATWPPTTPKPAWSPPSTEYSPSSRRRVWKRPALSSRSVSRRWLRLKAATLNRCQLYYIIKIPKLIFSIKVLK